MFKHLVRLVFLYVLVCCSTSSACAQQIVRIDAQDQYIFSSPEIVYLEDPSGKLSLNQVTGKYADKFKVFNDTYPTINNTSTYWYRIKIKTDKQLEDNYLFEFFDQTIDDITVFVPDEQGRLVAHRSGAQFNFSERLLHHKNFEFPVGHNASEQTYYFRVKSSQLANVIIVLRSVDWFIEYALDEYFTFGIFYGMILIFCFYNLITYLVMKQRYYLYYIAYILCIGLYEMATDGIAYQYLWPNAPELNKYAYGIVLYLMSIFALLFTRDLLHVKSKAPFFNKLILATIGLRTFIFLLCAFFFQSWFTYRVVEFLPLSVAFATGIYMLSKGYRAARFFVLGYSFLFLGFTIKLLVVLGYGWLFPGPTGHYSLAFCFILEMVFLSFAIGDKVRILKRKKENAQRRIIGQMTANMKLKDSLNKELEVQVSLRTKELLEKSEEILQKSMLIEQQNEELLSKNVLLKEQAEEIARMNAMLVEDNEELQTSIHKVTQARVLSADVNFEEFSEIYPDDDTCFKFLAELKWEHGYTCYKCGHEHYFNGRYPYSRRCAKCSYDESVTANTIFQNTRIPINKAFYMVFLIYTTKGKISSHKLSEILSIRQGTCWSYSSKVKKVMEDRKKELQHADEKGWSKLVLESPQLA